MINYKCYTPQEIVLISTIIGILIGNRLDYNGQNVLGNVLVDIGQVLFTMAAQEQAQQPTNNSNSSGSSNSDLQKQIDDLKKQLDQLKGSC
ncbi:MAG: hypothetical protein AB6733_17135 [Clostridiaceae bacterium]